MISVIVPVYNCEMYLEASIKSLIKQTIFDQLEIIFVNDGSTDRSESILRSYVNNYVNMKLYSQPNKGVSAARNKGLQNSNGDYVCFFDADDEASPYLYERLLNLIESNGADMAIVDYSMIFPDGFEKKHRKGFRKNLSNRDAVLKEFFSGNFIGGNTIDKIYRLSRIKEISFPEGYAIGEDMFFVYRALERTNQLVIDTSESLYYYFLRPNSAMKSTFSDKHIDSVRLSKLILDEIKVTDKMYKYAEANYIHEICKMLALFLKSRSPQQYALIVDDYRKKIKEYTLRDALRYMDQKHFWAFLLMRYFPRVYVYIYEHLRIG